MKSISNIILLSIACASPVVAATTAQLYVDKLNTADGVNNPATGATWALIYDQNNDGVLPGGVADGASLTLANSAAIVSAFSNLELTDNKILANGDRIMEIGTVPVTGVLDWIITFDIGGGANQEVTGRKFAFYWFPDQAPGSTLNTTQPFSIGGFFESAPHVPSGSDYGMTIPTDGQSGNFLAFDSQSGWDEGRLVAVQVVPETSSALALSGLGLAALLRRRRN
ncbi:MAG: hypothetical protein J0M04_04095 [Verrucomicrobia bacterium]|nr:hypothetical protein [Verrucomicrobiota bacterium]